MNDMGLSKISFILLIIVVFEMIIYFAVFLVKNNDNNKNTTDYNSSYYNYSNNTNNNNEVNEKQLERSRVTTFKNEALSMINETKNLYTEISMNTAIISKYVVKDEDGNYDGLCVTLNGLAKNGYLNKDITNYGGVILIEVPYDGGETQYMAWIHNGKMGLNGISKGNIYTLPSSIDNEKLDDEISGGTVSVTSNLKGIKKMISSVSNGNVTIESDFYRGGTGSIYNNMQCVNSSIR